MLFGVRIGHSALHWNWKAPLKAHGCNKSLTPFESSWLSIKVWILYLLLLGNEFLLHVLKGIRLMFALQFTTYIYEGRKKPSEKKTSQFPFHILDKTLSKRFIKHTLLAFISFRSYEKFVKSHAIRRVEDVQQTASITWTRISKNR